MIHFDNISKVYPNGTVALNQIQLNMAHNEFVFLVGPNGAGKSTLLRMLYRAEKPTQGQVYIENINVTQLSRTRIPFLRRNIGVIFQDYKLLPNRTVFENIAFALQVLGERKGLIKKKVYQVLDLIGLSKKTDCFPREISGGEQQKVSIARAIVNNPKLLLADEPTGNLSPEASWEIIQLLNRIHLRKTTILVATHDQSIVDTMQKRVIVLNEGKVVRDQQIGKFEHAL